MMTCPPGNVGLPVIGDKSVEFYKDAVGFVQRKIEQHNSRIFCTRFLNQASVFVASNSGMRQLLSDEGSSFQMGYKQFMEGIYGENVIFSDGEDAQRLRSVLQQLLLCDHSIQNFQSTVDKLTIEAISFLKSSSDIPVYEFLKKLSTEICLSVFLDISFERSREIAEKIVALTTTHWHGIISVPVNLKLPMTNSKSTYGKALDAKKNLQQIIEDKLLQCSNGFPHNVKESSFTTSQQATNHLLLFTSALVPKAFASILTSFMVVTADKLSLQEQCRESSETLEHVLLEVQRMWPPFIGGRRLTVKDSNLDGFKIPKGHAVIFMTHHSHRDPSVFSQPDEFMPERWRTSNKDDRDKLFTFGGGPRCCLGQHMSQYLLKSVCSKLLENYKWELSANQDLSYKWLPVSRPKHDLSVIFTQVT